MSRPEKEGFEPCLGEQIRTIVEMNDSLVDFEHGKEHCILPIHYDELAKEILDVVHKDHDKVIAKKRFRFKSNVSDAMLSATYWFVCTALMIWLDNVELLTNYVAWVIGGVMGMVYYKILDRKNNVSEDSNTYCYLYKKECIGPLCTVTPYYKKCRHLKNK